MATTTKRSPRLTTDESTVCCSPIGSDDFDEEAAAATAKAFAALSDPVRLRLLSLITAAGDEGACVCDLVEPVGRSQPTVSHHLKILRDAGIVTSEKRGTWAWYRVVPDRLGALRDALR